MPPRTSTLLCKRHNAHTGNSAHTSRHTPPTRTGFTAAFRLCDDARAAQWRQVKAYAQQLRCQHTEEGNYGAPGGRTKPCECNIPADGVFHAPHPHLDTHTWTPTPAARKVLATLAAKAVAMLDAARGWLVGQAWHAHVSPCHNHGSNRAHTSAGRAHTCSTPHAPLMHSTSHTLTQNSTPAHTSVNRTPTQ